MLIWSVILLVIRSGRKDNSTRAQTSSKLHRQAGPPSKEEEDPGETGEKGKILSRRRSPPECRFRQRRRREVKDDKRDSKLCQSASEIRSRCIIICDFVV